MTIDLNDIWRDAQMWPADSISLAEKIQHGKDVAHNLLHGVSAYAHSPWESEKIQQSNEWKVDSVTALDALARTPCPSAVTSAYDSLCAGYLSPYTSVDVGDSINPVMNSWGNDNLKQLLSSFFQYIIEHSPNIVAVHNSMFFLQHLAVAINLELIEMLGLGTNPPLADQACRLIKKAFPKDINKERILFSLVKAGTSTTTQIVLENTTRESHRDIKDWILEQLFADPWPHGYVIDDYIDYILHYIDKGDLLSAISADKPSDTLISGTLEVYTYVVRGLEREVMWEEAGEYEEETEILFRLIDHLKDRELSLQELEHLSSIYNCLYYWEIIEDPEWLKKADKDQKAAQQILDVYEFAPNKEKINAAVRSTDSNNFYQAFQVIDNIREQDAFAIIFKATKNASYPLHLDMLARHIKNEDQAHQAIDWAINKYRINPSGYGGAAGAPGYNNTLKALAEVAGDYPGLGGQLILAGLDYGTTSHDVSAKALLKWPLNQWPDGALEKLDQAVKNMTRSLDLLTEARNNLRNTTPEKPQ